MPELFTTLRERYADRTGGYTRVIRTGLRSGDRAPMAIVELVDSPGEVRFEMLARKLGRKIYEEELCVPPHPFPLCLYSSVIDSRLTCALSYVQSHAQTGGRARQGLP